MNRMFASRTEKRDKASPENKIGDKEASPRKSPEQGNKALLKSSTMFSLFSSDKPEKSDKVDRRDVKVLEKAAEDSETSKIASIQVRLQELGLPPAPPCVIRATMKSTFGNNNIDKTVRYLQVQNMAIRGDIQPYDPNVMMKGCRNRNGVTCYLDALLFAMFAKLNAFEYMLQGDIQDENKRNLAVLLRAFVTLLRSGELIQPDLVALIQDSLAKCGWEAANRCQQQDTSEAFGFISETLELPLLRLKVDLYHTGKKDDADHRFVEERLLNIAVPSLEDDKVVRLEDCLMEYFNGQVEVQRHNSDEKEESLDENQAKDQTTDEPEKCSDDKRILLDTLEETPTQSPTIRSPTDNMSSELFALHKSISHQSRPSMSARTTGGFRSPSVDGSILGQRRLTSPIWDASSSAGDERPTRTRSMSLMQRVIVGEDGRMTPTSVANLSPSDDIDNKKQKVANVITLPAWQVFRWIPWFSPDKNEPNSDADLIRNFNQRPVIGICLKRYRYHEDGSITKIHTEVDIPDSLRMPHIIANGGDSLDDSNCLSTEYKLVLQSVVSHKGPKFDDGHYVSLARVAPKILTENRRYDADPPPDYEEAQWVKFDDLKPIGEKVQPVDDIKSALKAETPYLLFYQIVPTMDDNCSTPTSSGQPPSYTDSRPSTSSRCGQTADLEKSLGQLPMSPGANGMGSAIETSMNVDELVVSDTMGSDAEPIRVNIERVPTLSAEKIPNSVSIEINPANLQPLESKKPAVSYFPMFYEAEATQAQSSPQPQPSSPVPPSSPRPSSDSTRHRVSFDDNEKMSRTSGQFNDQNRLIAGSQNDGSSGGERASSSRFGFGRAVVRFSRSASRHSRSSSHSVPPGEENSNHGRFSLDSRKSISLSNITRSLVGKESRDFLRDKQCDATTSHVALPSLPVIESPTATNPNAHIDVPRPQHGEHHEEQVSSTETLPKSSGEHMENVGRVSDVSIAIGEVENMDTPVAIESELDVPSSKKRKRRGKKKASGGHEHDPERQCQVM